MTLTLAVTLTLILWRTGSRELLLVTTKVRLWMTKSGMTLTLMLVRLLNTELRRITRRVVVGHGRHEVGVKVGPAVWDAVPRMMMLRLEVTLMMTLAERLMHGVRGHVVHGLWHRRGRSVGRRMHWGRV